MEGYFDLFDGPAEVIKEFNAPADALDNATVYLAHYRYKDYSGSAIVIFEKDGKLYEVNGGHCSCSGLEDQWNPEETSWESLKIRPSICETSDAEDHIRKVIASKL